MIIVPISFVSEHVETMVELDIEYKEIADKHGVPFYRVKALGTNESFIEGLASLVMHAFTYPMYNVCYPPINKCPAKYKECLCRGKNNDMLYVLK